MWGREGGLGGGQWLQMTGALQGLQVHVLRNDRNAPESFEIIEPPHGKTNNLHMRKQRRRSASQ